MSLYRPENSTAQKPSVISGVISAKHKTPIVQIPTLDQIKLPDIAKGSDDFYSRITPDTYKTWYSDKSLLDMPSNSPAVIASWVKISTATLLLIEAGDPTVFLHPREISIRATIATCFKTRDLNAAAVILGFKSANSLLVTLIKIGRANQLHLTSNSLKALTLSRDLTSVLQTLPEYSREEWQKKAALLATKVDLTTNKTEHYREWIKIGSSINQGCQETEAISLTLKAACATLHLLEIGDPAISALPRRQLAHLAALATYVKIGSLAKAAVAFGMRSARSILRALPPILGSREYLPVKALKKFVIPEEIRDAIRTLPLHSKIEWLSKHRNLSVQKYVPLQHREGEFTAVEREQYKKWLLDKEDISELPGSSSATLIHTLKIACATLHLRHAKDPAAPRISDSELRKFTSLCTYLKTGSLAECAKILGLGCDQASSKALARARRRYRIEGNLSSIKHTAIPSELRNALETLPLKSLAEWSSWRRNIN